MSPEWKAGLMVLIGLFTVGALGCALAMAMSFNKQRLFRLGFLAGLCLLVDAYLVIFARLKYGWFTDEGWLRFLAALALGAVLGVVWQAEAEQGRRIGRGTLIAGILVLLFCG